MAAILSANPNERDDSGYQEALQFFHMGEWQQAISALEGLRSRYPDDPRITRMLEDARFKANLDANSTVREKRVILPWRAILLRVTTIALVLGLLAAGYYLIQWRVLPIINAMQLERQQQLLLTEAQALFTANDLAGAEELYLTILQKFPELEEAQSGLAAVHSAQELLQFYNEAVGAEQNGDDETALKLYSELQMKAPGYRDVSARILAIRHRGDLAELYNQAVTLQKLWL